jgi:pyruvate dehydrogenase (quinone)
MTPLPSHITLTEAKKFATTIIKGDSREGSMIAAAVRQVLSGVLPEGKE